MKKIKIIILEFNDVDNTDFINDIFKLLIRNKNFPSYQAERRIDLFVNFFLEDILRYYFKGSVIKYIAPEFPLKKEGGHQSTNIDYLCTRETGKDKKILFIELKTEGRSFDTKQYDIYLYYQHNKTWGDCVTDIKEIALSASMPYPVRVKYYFLIKSLFNAGLLNGDKDMFDKIDFKVKEETSAGNREKQKIKRDFFGLFKKLNTSVKVEEKVTGIEIVYLAPDSILKEKGFDSGKVQLIPLNRLSNKIPTDYPEIWNMLIEILNKL